MCTVSRDVSVCVWVSHKEKKLLCLLTSCSVLVMCGSTWVFWVKTRQESRAALSSGASGLRTFSNRSSVSSSSWLLIWQATRPFSCTAPPLSMYWRDWRTWGRPARKINLWVCLFLWSFEGKSATKTWETMLTDKKCQAFNNLSPDWKISLIWNLRSKKKCGGIALAVTERWCNPRHFTAKGAWGSSLLVQCPDEDDWILHHLTKSSCKWPSVIMNDHLLHHYWTCSWTLWARLLPQTSSLIYNT